MTALDSALRDMDHDELLEEDAAFKAAVGKRGQRKALADHKRETREWYAEQGVTDEAEMCFGICVECPRGTSCKVEADLL